MNRELTQLFRELTVLLEDPQVRQSPGSPSILVQGDPKSLASVGTCTHTHRQNT